MTHANLHIGNPQPMNDQSIHQKFQALTARWKDETAGLSSPTVIANHPALRQIIDLGPAVLPLILQNLQEQGGWWFPALRLLTKTNPVPPEARGDPEANRQAWLEWGQANEYLNEE